MRRPISTRAPRARVVAEAQLRNAPQLQGSADARAEEAARLLEAFLDVGAGSSSSAERIEVDRGEAEVAADLDVADARARQPRILDLRQQQLVQQPLDLGCDTMSFCELARHQADLARDLRPFVALDLVAGLDVVVIAHTDAAFGAGANLVDVVLEAPQRLELRPRR